MQKTKSNSRCRGGAYEPDGASLEEKESGRHPFDDVKAAFNNVSSQLLTRRMVELGIDAGLIRWTNSFVVNRRVKLVLDGE
jgi:hypothetical protein